jgi:hypothetical protein
LGKLLKATEADWDPVEQRPRHIFNKQEMTESQLYILALIKFKFMQKLFISQESI